MQAPVVDLKEIRRLAKQRERKHLDFRNFVKFELDWMDDELDALVHEVTREVSAQVDCTQCANCCNSLMIVVTKRDIGRITRRLGVPRAEFEAQHIKEYDGDRCLRTMPCRFQEGKLCSIYADRPRA